MIANVRLPNANAVFARAISAITSARYPARIDYTIVVSGLDGSVFRVNHYPESYRSGTKEIDVNSEDGCECESDLGGSWSISVGARERSPDLLGVPHLTPTYMFGLNSPIAIEHSGGGHVQPQMNGLRPAPSPPAYAVALIDSPFVDGTRTYHLTLRPLSDPKKYRLRELWVGADDYLPRKAIVAGNFASAPLADVRWTIDFSIVHSAPFILRETTSVLFLPHRQVVKDAAVAFEDISAPNTRFFFNDPLVEAPLTGAVLVEPRV